MGIADRSPTMPSRLRSPRVAAAVLIAAPIPVAVALALTARPVYPDDACFYGAPQASIDATDHYLGLMAPLAMFGMAAVAVTALPIRGRWRILAPLITAWALAALVSRNAAQPLVVFGGNIAIFGALLTLVIVVIVVVAGKESSWIRSIGWFEFVFVLPLLLGIAGLLAQPACYNGDPPAPLR
jgi:hypothetical protein